jgi:tRNA(His) guanylyltransferase
MNTAAQSVCRANPEVVMAYGQSDEFSFLISKKATLFNRRCQKLVSTFAAGFAAAYVFHWNAVMGQPLLSPPCFDARVVCYPTDANMIDYFRWRQADCHINNLYNTTFWALVKSGLTVTEAHQRLKGSTSAVKNEILWEFGINYNTLPEVFKKGSVLCKGTWEVESVDIFPEVFYRDRGILEERVSE